MRGLFIRIPYDRGWRLNRWVWLKVVFEKFADKFLELFGSNVALYIFFFNHKTVIGRSQHILFNFPPGTVVFCPIRILAYFSGSTTRAFRVDKTNRVITDFLLRGLLPHQRVILRTQNLPRYKNNSFQTI